MTLPTISPQGRLFDNEKWQRRSSHTHHSTRHNYTLSDKKTLTRKS